jgi:AcrR family transcriptional regulator
MDIDADAPREATPATPLTSVWTRPQRRQKEQLSRERIVAEAIALLDEEGLEALSMRSLGQRLGAGATSLYRHVASKDELIELVVDEVYGEMEIPEITDPADWRPALVATARTLRATGLRHMWLMGVLGQVGLNYLGPNVVAVTSRGLAIMTTAGFDTEEAARVLNAMSSFVIGITTAEAGWLLALRRQGYDEADWARLLGPTMTDSAAEISDEMATFYTEQLQRDPATVRGENFEYGLDLVLDGIQGRLTAKLGGR